MLHEVQPWLLFAAWVVMTTPLSVAIIAAAVIDATTTQGPSDE